MWFPKHTARQVNLVYLLENPSLVAQWKGICLLVQETQVRFLPQGCHMPQSNEATAVAPRGCSY